MLTLEHDARHADDYDAFVVRTAVLMLRATRDPATVARFLDTEAHAHTR